MAPINDGGGSYPPNLPSAGKEIRVNHDALHDVYVKLQNDRDLFDKGGSGTLRDFQGSAKGRVEQHHLGDYPAGQGLHQTCQNAENHIGNVYKEFLDGYQKLIDAIKRTADNHKKAEEANEQAVNNVHPKNGSWG
ncbi:MAG: hypothetical protein JWO67_3061 [Streptosporangiaceae bacterium]|jgi:hypothetical protein|nr:hypothetical protein [Streptosporangiaceae bacterium]